MIRTNFTRKAAVLALSVSLAPVLYGAVTSQPGAVPKITGAPSDYVVTHAWALEIQKAFSSPSADINPLRDVLPQLGQLDPSDKRTQEVIWPVRERLKGAVEIMQNSLAEDARRKLSGQEALARIQKWLVIRHLMRSDLLSGSFSDADRRKVETCLRIYRRRSEIADANRIQKMMTDFAYALDGAQNGAEAAEGPPAAAMPVSSIAERKKQLIDYVDGLEFFDQVSVDIARSGPGDPYVISMRLASPPKWKLYESASVIYRMLAIKISQSREFSWLRGQIWQIEGDEGYSIRNAVPFRSKAVDPERAETLINALPEGSKLGLYLPVPVPGKVVYQYMLYEVGSPQMERIMGNIGHGLAMYKRASKNKGASASAEDYYLFWAGSTNSSKPRVAHP